MTPDPRFDRPDVPEDVKAALRAGQAAEARRVSDLRRLACASSALADLGPDADPFELIATTIHEMTANTAVVVATEILDGGTRYRVRSVAGLGDTVEQTCQVLGIDPRWLEGRITDAAGELARSRQMTRYPGGIHELSRGEIPRAAARALERAFGLRAVYGISFARGSMLYGNVAVLARDEAAVNVPLIEAFASQVMVALERRQTALRERRLAEGLRTVAELADELVAAETVDVLCLRAVELARERLCLERCSIYLVDGDNLRGTYGTDLEGRTSDEHHVLIRNHPASKWALDGRGGGAQRWGFDIRPRQTPSGEAMVAVESGWIAWTPIQTATHALGVLFNDAAITGGPLDEVQQDVVGVYCSMLATMIEHKRAGEAIRQAAQEWRTTFDAMRDSLMVLDREGVVLRCNRATTEVLGLGYDAIVGQHCYGLIHGAPSPLPDCPVRRALASRRRETTEMVIGGCRWLITVDPVLDADGEAVSLIHAMSDVTAAREAQQALRESEERYRRIVTAANEGIWQLDAQDRTSFVNARMAAMLGCRPEEMIGGDPRDFVAEAEHERFAERAAQRRQGFRQAYETRLRRRDGSLVWTLASTVPLFNAEGQYDGSLGLFTDITELKRTEERLRRSSRLEAVGTLAGGVAHDFNNILTGILGYAGFLAEEHPDSTDVAHIRELAERATGLTRQLLLFSRRQPASRQVVDVNGLIGNLLKMLVRVIGEDVAVTFTPGPGVGTCSGDPGQLEQILLNVAVNARDAMPEGGTLTIRTYTTEVGAQMPADVDLTPGCYLVVAMTDTGCGMDEWTRQRIFEPFFTTKEMGKGTGLGMATAYGIARDHGGDIGVDSAPGRGTTIRLYLPAIAESPPEPAEAPAALKPPGGEEALLVVEDQTDVLEIARRILGDYGYTVYAAQRPSEARELFAAHADEIALLLTDVVMPEESGPALYRALSAQRPGLKVLYMSGYAEHRAAADGAGVPEGLLLQKPFAARDLAERVRQALDEAPPRRSP